MSKISRMKKNDHPRLRSTSIVAWLRNIPPFLRFLLISRRYRASYFTYRPCWGLYAVSWDNYRRSVSLLIKNTKIVYLALGAAGISAILGIVLLPFGLLWPAYILQKAAEALVIVALIAVPFNL